MIVGGSAAGLFAGELLARRGVRVRLIDAGGATPPASRTLIVTRHLVDALGFSPDGAVANHINRFDLYAAGRAISVPLAKPDLVVERRKILELLAERALDAGVDLRFGHQLVDVEAGPRGAVLTVRDIKRDRLERMMTARLVGADGAASRVARLVGLDAPVTVPLLQAVVRLPHDLPADVTQVWFDPRETPYFYWVIPDGPGRAVAGLIGTEGRHAHGALRRFLDARGMEVSGLQAGRIPLAPAKPRPWRRAGACDVFLVGDAAGHVKVTTVGGLVTGLSGARAAAESIATGLPYGTALRPLHRELTRHRWVRRILDRFRAADYDALLGLMNERTVALLGASTRDELARTFVRILGTQPRLLLFARRLVTLVALLLVVSGCTTTPSGIRLGYASWNHLRFSLRANWQEFVGWSPIATTADETIAEREGWWGEEVPTLPER